MTEIPERMRTCEHRWSPAVMQVTLGTGDTVNACRCLKCGLWLEWPTGVSWRTTWARP